jgi:8-oxo-dGTP pyrophosphatase MutT (NUDIX family)
MKEVVVKTEILRILESYQTDTLIEQKYKNEMLEFLTESDNPLYMSNQKGHFTASAWIVSADHKSALLTEHAKIGKWFQLGGHIEENDSSFLAACLREAEEESGIHGLSLHNSFIIDIDVHTISEYKGIPEHPHLDITCYLLAPEKANVIKTAESKNLQWVPLSEIKSLTDDLAIHRMVDKTINMSRISINA